MEPLLDILVCIVSFCVIFDALSGIFKTRATVATKMSNMLLIYHLSIVAAVMMLQKII